MQINRLDHLVLTVADIERTVDFYSQCLGMRRIEFASGRVALTLGSQQKINLHQLGREFEPKASKPSGGSADLCFILDTPLDEAVQELEQRGVTIIEGPVDRTGATGPIRSIYLRDPDGNLVELSNYV